MQVSLLIGDAWRLQKGLFPRTWYGIAVRLYPDGKYETEYNFDPDCIANDTAFMDT
jgi:hypothetical protein